MLVFKLTVFRLFSLSVCVCVGGGCYCFFAPIHPIHSELGMWVSVMNWGGARVWL